MSTQLNNAFVQTRSKCARVAPLTFIEFEHYWPEFERALDAEPELWQGGFTTKGDIRAAVHDCLVQPWAVADEHSIRLVFMTTKQEHCDETCSLVVFWAYGEGLREFMPLLSEALDVFAADHDCRRIEVHGRKGFERVLAPFGGRFEYSVFARDVRVRERN